MDFPKKFIDSIDRYLEIRFVLEKYISWNETSNRNSHPAVVYRHTKPQSLFYNLFVGTSKKKNKSFIVDPEDCKKLTKKGYYHLYHTLPRDIFLQEDLKENLSNQKKYKERMFNYLELKKQRR